MASAAPSEAAVGQRSSALRVGRCQRVLRHGNRLLQAEHFVSQHAGIGLAGGGLALHCGW